MRWYRAMKRADDGRPACEATARGLGVRASGTGKLDVMPTDAGLVAPRSGGMRVDAAPHALVEPDATIHVKVFSQALCATRSAWRQE